MKYNTSEFDELLVKFYFGLYTFTVTITLVNIFIVLLTVSFNEVKDEIDNGKLNFEHRLNNHFWMKANKMADWIADKLCFIGN